MLGRGFMSFGGGLTSRSAAVIRFMSTVPARGCLQLPVKEVSRVGSICSLAIVGLLGRVNA